MTRPTLLLAVSFFCLISYGQKTDTLCFFYRPGKFNLSQADQQKLTNFLQQRWDKISINGHTDDTEDEEYNLELSKKRSESVYKYCVTKNGDSSSFSFKYFGEAMPGVENSSDDNRALNRRTVIIGYRYERITPKIGSVNPRVDPMLPVTKALENGLIITYRPGNLPADFYQQLANNLQLVSNTVEMRQNNLYNNTTRGEILSSVMIVCGGQIKPCKLDSPILIKVPIPDDVVCPIEKVKFFNSTLENGKGIWQEQNKLMYPEVIDGKKYIRILVDDLCTCFNFDFKVDPDCFETDTTRMLITNADIRNLSAELKGLNSVYLPRKLNDSTYEVLFIKNKLKDAAITFSLFKGKRRIRGFRDQPVTAFPYDEATKQYLLSSNSVRIYFPKLEVWDVVLRVNKLPYRVAPEKNEYSFVYMNHKKESVTVDFSITDSRGRVTVYRNQPIESLPYDESKEYRIIDKNFLKALRNEQSYSVVNKENGQLTKQ